MEDPHCKLELALGERLRLRTGTGMYRAVMAYLLLGPATPLLRAALRWDLGRGAYLHNVLVYRAARRLLARLRPRWLIYPFENKALEKALLLAAREQHPPCRIVGFQHTSITRRPVAAFRRSCWNERIGACRHTGSSTLAVGPGVPKDRVAAHPSLGEFRQVGADAAHGARVHEGDARVARAGARGVVDQAGTFGTEVLERLRGA